MIGLFNRTFLAGVDNMAFQMVAVLGADQEFAVVGDTYRAFPVFRFTNGAVTLGWPVLEIGTYRAGLLGRMRPAALASMFMLPMGTLKGTEIRSIGCGPVCSACSAWRSHVEGRSSAPSTGEGFGCRPGTVERGMGCLRANLSSSDELSECVPSRVTGRSEPKRYHQRRILART